MKNSNAVLDSLTRLWPPLIAGVALTLACQDPALCDPVGRQIGRLFSNSIYTAYILLSVGLLVFLSARVPGKRTVWWLLDISLCTLVLVHGLKLLTGLPRPSGGPTGFPSGHTAFAFALAWLALEACPRLAPLWFALAVAIGWSRVEVHAHFAYQVMAGAALGIALAWWVSHRPGGVIFPRCLQGRRQSS